MIIDAFSHAMHGGYLDRLAESGGEWTKRVIAMEIARARDRPNMLDMALRARQLEENGIDISLLEHISPIEWENVVLYGDYVISRELIR